MIRIISIQLLTAALFLFAGCGGNTSKKNAEQKDSAQVISEQKKETSQANEFNSEEGLQVSVSSLKDLNMAGVRVSIPYSDITSVMKKEMPGLLSFIAEKKKTMTGPVYVVLNETPEKTNSKIEVFIGIPVNNVSGIQDEKVMNIKASSYYRMEANASPGEGLKAHTDLQKSLKNKGLTFNYPVLETYRETQNSEMVQILSKTILYYPKK